MSYPRIRYRRQGVSRDESLVSYEQDLRFKVSASREESYLGFDEETNLDHDEATYSDHDESLVPSVQDLRFNIPEVDDESYLDPDEATYSDHDESLVPSVQDLRFNIPEVDDESYLDPDEATYSDHDESLVPSVQDLRFNIPEVDDESYLDPDEETGFSDGGQDDPRWYGICPGRFDLDAISNNDYRRGNDNFDYIKAWWPQTIPRHYTWIGKYPMDERFALVGLKDYIGISLRDLPGLGKWVPYTFQYRVPRVPYIATITYTDPLVTLSYALLRERPDEVCVVGVKLDPALPCDITIVSRWYVVKAAEGQGGHTNTEGILRFQRPPSDRYMKWSPLLCEWWVPSSNSSLLEKLHFPLAEVDKRST